MNKFIISCFFTVVSVITYSQEDCGNGIDDDGDGLIDCLDADCRTNTIPTGSLFNTATNGTGGILAAGVNDTNWEISTGSIAGPYSPATVLGITAGTSSYYTSPWPDCSWISHNINGNHFGSIDYYYKTEFYLPCTNTCNISYTDSAAFCLYLDFFADNSVDEVYINGIPQSAFLANVPSLNQYFNNGFTAAGVVSVSLCNGWQPGLNVLIIKVSSAQPYAGFLAQASTNSPPVITPYIIATQNAAICLGDTYTLPWGPAVGVSGSYADTSTAFNGCDSISIFQLIAMPAINTIINASICSDSTYTLPNNSIISVSGIYTDTLIAIGGCDSIITTQLTVNPTAASIQNVSICNGYTYTLPDLTVVSAAGTYYDTVTTTKGCDSVITTVLSLKPNSSGVSNPVVCSNEGFTLSNGNIVNTSGIYKDTLVSANGCDSVVTINLTVNPSPIAVVDSNVTITLGATTSLLASGGAGYTWYPASGLSCTNCFNPDASPTEATTYCVFISSAYGCLDTACVTVFVKTNCVDNLETLTAPNAFSPNADNVNDEFCVEGWNTCVEKFTVVIFNRWGEKVYESTNPDFCWDGTYNEKPMDSQVFVYYIKAKFTNQNEPFIKKGNISLIR